MYDHYNKKLRKFAHELRNESVSKTERYLWKAFFSKAQSGIKLKRQRPIPNFIVDFFSHELKLIIEIDGSSHILKGDYDARRQKQLEDAGFTIVRFTEGEVLLDIDSVITKLQHVIYCLQTGDLKNPPP